jgi:hypothetical protein
MKILMFFVIRMRCSIRRSHEWRQPARGAHLSRVLPGSVSRDCADSMDAGLYPAAVVFLEFHPARELSRDWARLPARTGSRRPVHVVSSSPGDRDCVGELLPPGSVGCGLRQYLFHERHSVKGRLVESTMLLPLLFVVVAALFTTLAQRMGREMATLPPLRAYTINLAGSLAGVVVLGLISWLELSPTMWFAIAFGAAVPLLWTSEIATDGTGGTSVRRPSMAILAINLVLLAGSLVLVHSMARGAIWSPYYKITVSQQGPDTVVEVNNIFHQSMAPVDQKEYFYQWPYSVFGDTFQDVLILGAGSGTDVAAALRHGVRHVDAVEIDPAIIRLGREHHPDHPYSDPRVTVINDDARHFLRTTTKQYDLVVFALIDSLTMQSSFSGVRLESYMFTEESFHDVRNRLKPMASSSSTTTSVSGGSSIGSRIRRLWRLAPNRACTCMKHGRSWASSWQAATRATHRSATRPGSGRCVQSISRSQPARIHERDQSIEPARDDWPFLYLAIVTFRGTTSSRLASC